MSDSDIEIKKIAPMKPVKKPPNSPTEGTLKSHEKKISTKIMIHEALKELKARKGVSSYAIKKYLEEKYSVETAKAKYLIKKTLKRGIEDGSIIQVKGIGASGSFKLAVIKEKPKKKLKMNKEKSKEKSTKEKAVKDKPKKEKMDKTEKLKEKAKKVKIDVKDTKGKVTKSGKPVKSKIEKEKKGMEKKGMEKKGMEKKVMEKKGKVKEVKEKAKGSKTIATPAKKRAIMMKRKSIGSIIKPPKMKPKSKA